MNISFIRSKADREERASQSASFSLTFSLAPLAFKVKRKKTVWERLVRHL